MLTLGLSGHLYAGNSVLYDKETNTDWLQLNGEPLRGHYFGKARLSGKEPHAIDLEPREGEAQPEGARTPP